jgi:GTP-binding protein
MFMPAAVVLLGRPTVGKSTLFNRLIRSNRAITHDRPGVTRDRLEGLVKTGDGRSFRLFDTGGVTLDAHARPTSGPDASRGLEAAILLQAADAMREADALCLVVDGREGLMPFDEYLAAHIRTLGKPILVVVNKVDGMEREALALAGFHGLGFPLLAVSAEHGHNIRALEEELAAMLPGAEEEEPSPPILRLAVLGRPNVGKSSLVNAMIGASRLIVSEQAGTTRDSVDVGWETENGGRYEFVDTAGIRRRPRVVDAVERLAVQSAIKSTTKADVTLLLLDAAQGVTQQDKRLISLLDARKTPFLILVNKIDLVRPDQRKALKMDFAEVPALCGHVPVLMISALKGAGMNRILPVALRIREEGETRVTTGRLNRAMEEALRAHQPPLVNRARAKFFYLTQAESRPPTFVFFVSDAERVPQSYVRYLEKSLRRILDIRHAPLRVHLRSSHRKRDADGVKGER